MLTENNRLDWKQYSLVRLSDKVDGRSLVRFDNKTLKEEVFLVYPFIDYGDGTKEPKLDLGKLCSSDRNSSIFQEGSLLCDEKNNLLTLFDTKGVSYFGVWISVNSKDMYYYLNQALSTSVFSENMKFVHSMAYKLLTKKNNEVVDSTDRFNKWDCTYSSVDKLKNRIYMAKAKFSELVKRTDDVLDRLSERIFHDDAYESIDKLRDFDLNISTKNVAKSKVRTKDTIVKFDKIKDKIN